MSYCRKQIKKEKPNHDCNMRELLCNKTKHLTPPPYFNIPGNIEQKFLVGCSPIGTVINIFPIHNV